MVHTKKFISASSALILAGASVLSSVSADSTATSSSADTSISVSSSENTGLALKVRIEGNYKVMGDFTPLSTQKVQLYKVTVSYSDGGKNFVFTVPTSASTFTDWHARQNIVNTYTISAILEDGTVIAGNSAKVVMGANGEATTEDALGSAHSQTNAGPQWNKDERKQMHQEIKDERKQMQQEIRDDRMKMKQENTENRQMSGSGMNRPPMPTGELMGFLRNPLTTEEQTVLKTLMQKRQAEGEAIKNDTTLSPQEKWAKVKELMTAHMADLLPYISTDKQDAFKKMMEEKIAMMTKNHEMRQTNQDNRQEFKEGAETRKQEFKNKAQEKKQALSEKNRTLLGKLVNTLTLERLQAILAKVEKASSMTKKERVLAQLNEIGDMIQDKIDELTGTSSEDTIVQDILSADTGSGTVTQ